MGEIVGEIAERREADAQYDFECRLICKARIPEAGELVVCYIAARSDNRFGETGDSIEFRIAHSDTVTELVYDQPVELGFLFGQQ